MLKELVVLSLMVFLLSTVESNKPIKKVLSIVKDIKNEMVTVDEIVDALTPIIEGSCSCCNDKPQCQAILTVSGYPANYSVQALDQDGHYLCDLPDMPSPYGRYAATMDGNILCGGQNWTPELDLTQNCIYYKMGSFQNPMDILNEGRWHSSSWGRPYPNTNVVESHIFGGIYSPNTTEIANDVNSLFSYPYIDGTTGQCNIQFDDYVVITGGGYGATSYYTTVVAYNDDDFQYSLPNLVEARAFHGCGHYIDDDGNLVYLVTGGAINSNTATATTELSINEGAWFTVSSSGDLPTPRIGLRCVSLNNKVICTGGMEWGTTGAIIGEVVQWDIYSNEWIPTSSILPRYYHTASVLSCDEVKNYCITKKKSFPKTESVDIQNVDGSI